MSWILSNSLTYMKEKYSFKISFTIKEFKKASLTGCEWMIFRYKGILFQKSHIVGDLIIFMPRCMPNLVHGQHFIVKPLNNNIP